MLKKFTLAAFVALGTVTLAGISAQPAAADDMRSARVFNHGVINYGGNHGRDDRRVNRHGPRWKFLKHVRNGRIVCFKKRGPRHGYRHDRHGRRLGYRAVRRLIRSGRGHVMRCYRNV